jgi:spheroidene monooxygenase
MTTTAPPAAPPGRSQVRPVARAATIVGTVAVLVLVDFDPASRVWAWSRMVLRRRPLAGVPGLRFAKILGSGAGGGFGMKPSGTHQGLYLVFEDELSARAFADSSPLLDAYRAHARELCVGVLRASASRGSWSGTAIAVTAEPVTGGPIAALTRASIKPRHALEFWRHSPPSEAALAHAPGCLLAAGLGEAPLLRQATFSLWSDTAAMDAYARSGAHQEAIRAAYSGGFFSETMFVRFAPLQLRGQWHGCAYG